jgi:hypothetical protein
MAIIHGIVEYCLTLTINVRTDFVFIKKYMLVQLIVKSTTPIHPNLTKFSHKQ